MKRHLFHSRGAATLTQLLPILLVIAAVVGVVIFRVSSPQAPTRVTRSVETPDQTAQTPKPEFRPRFEQDAVGFVSVGRAIEAWNPEASSAEIAKVWDRIGYRTIERIDRQLANKPQLTEMDRYSSLYTKASLMNYEGEPQQAYRLLQEARAIIESEAGLKTEMLYNLIFLQGVTALRQGENENCILCRGESSCILPINEAARHTNPEGSRLAIRHFTEYLEQFPDDLEVRWLLNLAYLTLGEDPVQLAPRFGIPLNHYVDSEFDIGRFRDIGHLVGVNRLNQSGGAIMDDFNQDGLLDLVVTTFDPTGQMAFFRNLGDGKFAEQTDEAGLTGQFGGLNCLQTDYNNDGRLDIFIVRGAWVQHPMLPTLLRNEGDARFTDVTEESGLFDPVNSIAAAWADYDNDGWLDLFLCCERQSSRLYRNLRNGRFEEVGFKAGVCSSDQIGCKGAAWIDYDNDGYLDLFQNYLLPDSGPKLFHNNRDGTFTNVTTSVGIEGPVLGFSCWAWDFDNDGWQDLYASCYDRSLRGVIQGLIGEPHANRTGRLYRNLQGKGFADVTSAAGLDQVYVAMGSNFADFDNDGFLDIYLGTGDPNIEMLIPNRMLKNIGGKRFADISAKSGTGHLQKGHGVACGDWDRDGNVDLFIEMGGAINGDKYHNVLFQNPGHAHAWLTVKLVGEKSNRAAIGARIKIITAGEVPQTIYRTVSTGSSFGANPLQQTIGLGKAEKISTVEVWWPSSQTTQVFRDITVNQAIQITEFAQNFEKLDWKPIPIPAK